MLKALTILSLAMLLAAVPPAVGEAADGDLASLVAAERAFSRTSEEQGIKPAFLAFLARDSVIFRPGPVPGREQTESRPPPPGLLTWEPVVAEVSRAGDLGYTTGPWEFRASPEAEAGHGHYFSVWTREDGEWKVLVDIGVFTPPPAAPVEGWQAGAAPAKWEGGEDAGAVDEGVLLELDRELARLSREEGVLAAYRTRLAPEVRFLRNGTQPLDGAEAAAEVLGGGGALTWEPLAGGVAASADLGYTYGSYSRQAAGDEPAEEGHYLRVWRRVPDGSWKLAVDLLLPLPPPPQAAGEG